MRILWTSALLAAKALGQTRVPKVWDERALADWATPVAALGVRPAHYTAAEYYALPGDNYKTYPVYHPDREPAGYWDSLRAKKPEPLVDAGRIRTQADWVRAGEVAFRDLDNFGFRTNDPRLIATVHNPDAWKGVPLLADGSLWVYRWVVTPGGVFLSSRECAGCHARSVGDKMALAASPAPDDRHLAAVPPAGQEMFAGGVTRLLRSESISEGLWRAYTTPWSPDLRVEALRTATPPEAGAILSSMIPGTFARADSSPWFTTKIPDLRTARYQRYIDATGTHKLRGPEDIARYGNLVNGVDAATFGPHRVWPENRRKLERRYADEVLYAIGVYAMSLEPPRNPNPPDPQLAAAGQKIFTREGCIGCHAPPHYTTGKLTLAQGYTPPADHPNRADIVNVSVGTDPNLALRTRKGTGFYKVPSLRGVWDRPLLLHDGSAASLEEMFNVSRLSPDHVPGGWKGPGVTKRAIPGHEFGLRLPPGEKQALLAFLRSL